MAEEAEILEAAMELLQAARQDDRLLILQGLWLQAGLRSAPQDGPEGREQIQIAAEVLSALAADANSLLALSEQWSGRYSFQLTNHESEDGRRLRVNLNPGANSTPAVRTWATLVSQAAEEMRNHASDRG